MHRLHDPDRPLVGDVLPHARAVYARSCTGCCLHIVLDDDNLEDRNVDFCVMWALEQNHVDCYVLAVMLRRMSRSQRGRVARRLWERKPVRVGDPVEVLYQDSWHLGVVDSFDRSLEETQPRVNVRSDATGLFFRGCRPDLVRRTTVI